jgi:hypothetical protein
MGSEDETVEIAEALRVTVHVPGEDPITVIVHRDHTEAVIHSLEETIDELREWRRQYLASS